MSEGPARRVGFVTIWFERGQAYVTRVLRESLASHHETFIFARMGQVGTQNGVELHQSVDGDWVLPNLTLHPTYEIDEQSIREWIEENSIDVVIFNEEYDWHLADYCKQLGCKIVTYLDFYRDDWRHLLSLYDVVLCSTQRTYELVRHICNARYIGWAVDGDVFAPSSGATHTFFHSAGWLGINYRKNTPLVIRAFNALSEEDPETSLLVHAQLPLSHLPHDCQSMVTENPRIDFVEATVPPPGLFHRGRFYVYPSKLDGLGLTLIEALASGLPAIATDLDPMCEFVSDGENGMLVPVTRLEMRADQLAFPEATISETDLADAMRRARDLTPDEYRAMRRSARTRALRQFNTRIFERRLAAAVEAAYGTGRLLHVGSGKNRLPGYVNLDLYEESADRNVDARSLDYEDESVDLILTYHMIEHVPRIAGLAMFGEWCRALRVGGTLVAECPNFHEWIRVLAEEFERPLEARGGPGYADESKWQEWAVDMVYGKTLAAGTDGAGLIDGATHLAGYTPTILCARLAEAGFVDVSVSPGTDYHAASGLEELGSAWLAMRVEAVKAVPEFAETEYMSPDDEYMVPERVVRRERGDVGYGLAVDHVGGIHVYNRHRVAEAVFSRALGDSDRRVLDAGSGNGVFVLHLVQEGYDAHGVDPSGLAIEDARRYQNQLGLGAKQRFFVAPMEALPFDDRSFDGIYCGQVLEHVEDPGLALAELLRVLAPGGVLVLDVPIEDSEPSPDHRREFDEDGLRSLLRRAGFSDITVDRIPAGDPSGAPNIFTSVARRVRDAE